MKRLLAGLLGCVAINTVTSAVGSGAWINEFGQNEKVQFAGRVTSVEQLKTLDAQEQSALSRQPTISSRDKYQGWLKGPQLTQGFFRVEKIAGRWWLVDPDGRLFYSTGIDCISASSGALLNDKTRAAYKWLPPLEGEFAAAKGTSIYTANLIRKWGSEKYLKRAQDRATARLKAWGFTTLGNWCDDSFIARQELPYVHSGPNTWECKVPYIDGDICDAFHPDFPEQAIKAAAPLSSHRNDRFLIGYFIDNELPWWNLGYDVLAMDADAHARVAFVKQLKQRYGSIGKLNKAWGTTASSFANLRWPGEKAPPAAQADLNKFREAFADRFFAGWYRAIKLADSNHLVLGSRIPYPMNDVVRASARHTDVLSFNHYSVDVWPRLDAYGSQLNRPILVGEYGFDSLDAGLQGAHVKVKSQTERGVGYRYLTEHLAAKPYMVGSHYFQYIDEPVTGRSRDGENSFNGFVNVADIPYPELAAAARVTNAHIYEIHSGQVKPTERRPLQ